LLAPASENIVAMNITETRKTAKFAAQVSAIAIVPSANPPALNICCVATDGINLW
jgi:hypothetical protein